MVQATRVLPVGRMCSGACVGDWQCTVLLESRHHLKQTPSIDVRRLAERVAHACLMQGVSPHQGQADGAPDDSVRVATLMPSGRPVATVSGRVAPVCVSVSHTRLMRAAVACVEAFVGIDLVETCVPATTPLKGNTCRRDRNLDAWFTQGELGLLADRTDLTPPMLWAAKEAAYKAARIDTEFRPRRLQILYACGDRFRWRMCDRWANMSGEGVFFLAGDHVVAIATARMPHRAMFAPRRGSQSMQVAECF